jgi:hypothetical protein
MPQKQGKKIGKNMVFTLVVYHNHSSIVASILSTPTEIIQF